jgi:hypothetical protein
VSGGGRTDGRGDDCAEGAAGHRPGESDGEAAPATGRRGWSRVNGVAHRVSFLRRCGVRSDAISVYGRSRLTWMTDGIGARQLITGQLCLTQPSGGCPEPANSLSMAACPVYVCVPWRPRGRVENSPTLRCPTARHLIDLILINILPLSLLLAPDAPAAEAAAAPIRVTVRTRRVVRRWHSSASYLAAGTVRLLLGSGSTVNGRRDE